MSLFYCAALRPAEFCILNAKKENSLSRLPPAGAHSLGAQVMGLHVHSICQVKLVKITTLIFGLALAAVPSMPALQAGQSAGESTKNAGHPTSQDIANAKSQGMVWADTSAHVYHKDGEHYGTTKHGKFVTEADAQKMGFKPVKQPEKGKAVGEKKDQSGLDDSANTHSSSPPKK